MEFTTLIAEAEGRSYRGHAGVQDWWESVHTSLGGITYELVAFEELDDGVLSELIVSGEVEGVLVHQRMWQAARIQDGRALWWRTCRSEAEARDELGRA